MTNDFPIGRCPVKRDTLGHWTHPIFEDWLGDECRTQDEIAEWCRQHKLEFRYVLMEYDVKDPQGAPWVEYENTGGFACWELAPPHGAGWFLLSVHDTEDGPVQHWVRWKNMQP